MVRYVRACVHSSSLWVTCWYGCIRTPIPMPAPHSSDHMIDTGIGIDGDTFGRSTGTILFDSVLFVHGNRFVPTMDRIWLSVENAATHIYSHIMYDDDWGIERKPIRGENKKNNANRASEQQQHTEIYSNNCDGVTAKWFEFNDFAHWLAILLVPFGTIRIKCPDFLCQSCEQNFIRLVWSAHSPPSVNSACSFISDHFRPFQSWVQKWTKQQLAENWLINKVHWMNDVPIRWKFGRNERCSPCFRFCPATYTLANIGE